MMNALGRLSLAASLWAVACAAPAGPITSLDDVVYWTGAGAHRAAIAIDFDDHSSTDPALVWGFRWDGSATGLDMLNAVVAADPRLFVKISSAGDSAGAIIGLGYDRDDDGHFGASSVAAFDADGFAAGAPVNFPSATDPGDWYREGWRREFWHYGVSDGNPWTTGQWRLSNLGAPSRLLADGDWDSFAFASDANNPAYYNTVFAKNPQIATPPGGYADFDGDSHFDARDFLIWQRGLGLAAALPMQGDANGDGLVNDRDLAIWRSQFAGGAASSAATSVPEPGLWNTCASAIWVCYLLYRQRYLE
jgi:hypothetical protein